MGARADERLRFRKGGPHNALKNGDAPWRCIVALAYARWLQIYWISRICPILESKQHLAQMVHERNNWVASCYKF